MGSINFYLKKPEALSAKSLIYLQFKYNGKKLVFSFGQSINPSDWNENKQRLKKNNATTADEKHLVNDLLDNLEKECERAYNIEIKNGIPEPSILRKYLVDFMNQNSDDPNGPSLKKLIIRFIENEIKYKGRDKSVSTIKTYKTVLAHLNLFEQKERCKIDFDTITLDFYYKYVSFLKSKNLSPNAIGKDIQVLKVFMGEAIDLGYTTNLQFRHKKFAVMREETDAVYLTEKEIMDLFTFDFSKNKKLEQTRDLFVFGCFVGLRFSDYANVKRENIVKYEGDYFIKMITKKTKESVIIPCNPVIMKIFDRYIDNSNRLPRSISIQKFNEYLKEVARITGFSEKGRLVTDPTKQLWECISSHTARRSFATNYYLQGFPTIDLMKITGHRTERSFLKYIRVTKLDTAMRLNQHIKKNWSEKMLKIAS